MNPPPAWPFDTQTDALDALNGGTFWPRIRRWAEHMDQWNDQQRPPMGRHHPAIAHTRKAPRKAA